MLVQYNVMNVSMFYLVQYECGYGGGGTSSGHTAKLCDPEQTTQTIPLPNCRNYHGTYMTVCVALNFQIIDLCIYATVSLV